MIKVLAIDGGGMRGVIPSTFLVHLETLLNKRISDVFDLLIGTSTGGIIACMLASSKKFTAHDVLQMYYKEGYKIFNRSFWHKIKSLGNIVHNKYPSAGIEEVTSSVFGNEWLSHSLVDVVIPTFNIQNFETYFFKSEKAKEDPNEDFYLKDVVRATTAAPLYFPPALIKNLPNSRSLVCIDGGTFDNNPAMTGYVEAIKKWPNEQFLVVSIGTGRVSESLSFNQVKCYGAAQWAPEIMSVMLDSMSEKTDYYLNKLLPTNYFRFQVNLPENIKALDDTDPERLQMEQDLAYGEIQKTDFGVLCKILLA